MKKIIAILLNLSIIFTLATVSMGADCAHESMAREDFDATCMSRAKTVYTCSCGYTETVWDKPEMTIPDGTLTFAFEGELDGNTLTVTCTAYNNPGVCGTRLTLNYNASVLTPVSMENGVMWTEDVVALTINETKKYVRFYADDWGNNVNNGVVFKAVFNVADVPANWGLKIDTIPEDFRDWDTDAYVSYTVKSTIMEGYGDHLWDEGVISVEPTVFDEGTIDFSCTLCSASKSEAVPALERWEKGDVKNDGTLNLADIFMAKMLLTSGSVAAGSQPHDAADMNDDGTFNLSDIMMLKYQLLK